MTNADTPKPRPATDKTTQAMLREVARDMDVALYRRYSETEAAHILGISEKELEELRTQGHLAYLSISDKVIGFFGCQLLTYLLECVVEPDADPKPRPEPAAQTAQTVVSAAAELISVDDTIALMGIGRTKLYELLNAKELESVKIGRRTLVKRDSIRRFTDIQSG